MIRYIFDGIRLNGILWSDMPSLRTAVSGTTKSWIQHSSTVFDSYHMHFSSIQGDFRDFHFVKDSIRGKMSLSTKEKSGFVVQKLNADVKFYPEGMEFESLRPSYRKKSYQGFLRHAF